MSFFSCQVCNKDFTDDYSIVSCCGNDNDNEKQSMLCQKCYDKIMEDDEAKCPFCDNEDVFKDNGLEIHEFDYKDKYIIKLEKEKKEKKEKKSAEKNSIEKKVVTQKDRTFTGYVMKYIPDQTELIMTNKGDEIKCIVDYASQSFLDDEGEEHKSLNMVYTKFYKKAGAEKISSKNCWEHFKMDGEKINNLYE